MIDAFRRLLGSQEGEDAPGKDSPASPNDVRIATCALFIEMAKIDGEFSEEERRRIVSILRESYDMPEERIDILIEVAGKVLEGSIDLWRFTHRINETDGEEDKVRIVEMMWRLGYAHGLIQAHEDYLMHKLAHLLDLGHRQLIDAKMRALAGEV